MSCVLDPGHLQVCSAPAIPGILLIMGWLESLSCLIQCNAMGAIEVVQNMATNLVARMDVRGVGQPSPKFMRMDHRKLQGRVSSAQQEAKDKQFEQSRC